MDQDALIALQSRITAVAQGVGAIRDELTARIADATARLIREDNEQTRGAIKALQEILDLPEALQSERDQVIAGLSEQPDPDF